MERLTDIKSSDPRTPRGLRAALVVVLLAWAGSAGAGMRAAPGFEPGFSAETVSQGYCGRRVADFATNDRAIAVRNELAQRGYQAWVEAEGSLYSGTRSYVVFVAGIC